MTGQSVENMLALGQNGGPLGQRIADTLQATETKQALIDKGHSVADFADGLGNAHGLTIKYDDQAQPVHFTGAADPRGEGLARGV